MSCKKDDEEGKKTPPVKEPPVANVDFPKLFDDSHQMVVIAHRGGGSGLAENTIEAFESAIAEGVDYVEIDLRTTKDSVLVIMHDSDIDATTNGTGNVRDMTWEELSQYKVNGKYDIPRLETVLNTCKGRVNIYVDFKDADPEQTYTVIKAHNMEAHFVLYLNSVDKLKGWRAVAPRVPAIGSIPLNANPSEIEKILADADYDIIDNAYNPAVVQALHQKGKKVWLDIEGPWENPNMWNTILGFGVDGLQTDKSKPLIDFLIKNNKR
ncbi:MAG: glycerophosphodiester phosphodiesterase family protein [Chitinophagales bacterium]|nr:glycerophosphodiester phosphodiesterase family protein [Chitinophagales bacterium]